MHSQRKSAMERRTFLFLAAPTPMLSYVRINFQLNYNGTAIFGTTVEEDVCPN